MDHYFTKNQLDGYAKAYASDYQSADPFPHSCIDNFMDADTLSSVLAAFPEPDQMDFYRYDNPLEKKLAMDQLSKLPTKISSLLQEMNASGFLRFLEQLTGIEGLIPDPYYRGGGIHQIVRGGKLDVHIDFNIHPKLKLHRRLNVLLYLNKDWDESYGGYFELWQGKRAADGQHVLETCCERILPLFNRFLVFSTSERSYHGHPDPLLCPENRSRKSIALYYYTATRDDESVASHSTTFIKRPDEVEDHELTALREKRNKGRLTSS